MKALLRRSAKKIPYNEREALIESHLQFIKQNSKPSEVIVFGSVLTDKFDEFSDIDFVVIFDSEEKAKASLKKLYGTFGKPTPADYICVDRKTFDEKSELGGVFFVAKQDGRSVYKSNDSTAILT